MTPNEIADLFYTLVDDEPDADEVAVLMDAAYTMRNDERAWAFLIKLDTSISNSSGDTWQTEKSLPADFAEPYKMFVGTGGIEYEPAPFEEILRWKGVAQRYTVDFGQKKLRFMGPGNGDTAYLWYKYFPTSLIGLTDDQKDSAATIVWEKRFCPILAFDMAAMHLGGVDADDVTRNQVPFLNDTHKRLYQSMKLWDSRRRMKMFGMSSTPRSGNVGGDRPDVVSGI